MSSTLKWHKNDNRNCKKSIELNWNSLESNYHGHPYYERAYSVLGDASVDVIEAGRRSNKNSGLGGSGSGNQHNYNHHVHSRSLRRGDLMSSKSVDYSAMDSSDLFNNSGCGGGGGGGGAEESLRSRRHRSRSVEKLSESSRRIDMDSGNSITSIEFS